MELVQIISKILVYGGAALVAVIAISFFLSRKKKDKIKNSINNVPSIVVYNRNSFAANNEQSVQRRNSTVNMPIVYPIDPRINRDVKILRKPTVTKKEIQERIKQEENSFKRTNGTKKRYTIVNDEIKKSSNFNVINL